MNTKMNKQRQIQATWIVFILLAVVGGVVFSLILFVPYEYQKGLLDSLAADGVVESFNPGVHLFVQICTGPLAIIFWLAFLLAVIFKDETISRIELIPNSIRKFSTARRLETINLLNSIRPSKSDVFPLIVLVLITVLGIFFRYAFLWKPMGHDETYTFMAFASRGLRFVISDYHLPNNHVFHTILVNLAYQLFGDSPAVIRLPAFLAGVMLIPTTYLVARLFYSTIIALVSASIVASLPVLVDYSTIARGYTFLALFTLILISLAAFIKDHKNLVGWFLFAIIAAIGLYTLPTMVYPVGMVITWLLLSGLIKDISIDYGRSFFLHLLCFSIVILLFAAVLYSPIIINSGIQSLIGNEVIESLSWSDFTQSVPVRIKNTWAEWNREVPSFVSILALLGLVVSLFYPKYPQNRRVPLILSGLLWIGTALIIQKVAPWPRIWLFLLPLFIIWISAGLVGLIDLFFNFFPNRLYFKEGMIALMILLPLLAGFVRSYTQYSQKLGSRGESEEIAYFLKENLKPEDVVVVTSPDTILLKYYLSRHDLSVEFTELRKDKAFDHALVVVNKALGQTLRYVLERRSFLDDVRIESPEEIYSSKRFAIYKLSQQ
jgi:hypothetical protein